MTNLNNLTTDYIFDGRLRLAQYTKGFRFSVDAPLLIWYASQSGPANNCVDLGAGCGIVGLGLLATGTAEQTVAVEIQERMCQLCHTNAQATELAGRFSVVQSDMTQFDEALAPNSAELVVMNPPYWPLGNGRLPQNEEKKIAGHEVYGNLTAWVSTAARLIRGSKGRLSMVFPARRLDELFDALTRAKLAVQRAKLVYPGIENPAELILLEASPNTRGRIEWEPPLVLKHADGSDTDPASEILFGHFSERLRSLPDLRPSIQMP